MKSLFLIISLLFISGAQASKNQMIILKDENCLDKFTAISISFIESNEEYINELLTEIEGYKTEVYINSLKLCDVSDLMPGSYSVDREVVLCGESYEYVFGQRIKTKIYLKSNGSFYCEDEEIKGLTKIVTEP